PVITNAPESQTGVAKGTLALICNATGNPRPRIDWRKDNKEISKNRYRIVPYVFESGSGSVLWIAPARKKKDKARYTCVASNRLGDVSESADVHFYDEEATPSGFPHIDINPTVKTVERSRAVSMECGISGSPTPSIRWFRNYQPLYLNGTRIRMDPITVNKTTFPGSLIISTSNDTDNGKYHCSGTNVHGTVFSKGTSIYVKERIVYPRFSIPPRKSYDVKINDPFNLTCVAVGSPMPVVKWQKQTSGGLVDVWPLKGMPPIVGMNVYHMQRVTESANYTCVAKSRISTITTTTEVTVKSVPKAPTNVHQYSDATSTTLSVAWDSGDLPPATVTGYTVFYRVMGSTTPYQYIDQISSESFTITGLQPYTEYDVVLMASNAQGQGNTTQPVYLRTAEAAPRSAPREVGAYLYQTNTIMVTWLEPQHPNGVISSYNVYYTSNPSLPVSEWMDVPVRNDRRLTALRRLVPHVTYSIRVSATNGAGESPYSDIAVVKTTHGVPPQPRNFHGEAASTTSIHLTWDRPNWGGASSFDITSYMVFYNCSSPSCSSQITFEPVKEFTLGRLRPNTRYDIRLAAQTVHGVGAETSMISVSTLSDVPSAPPEHLVVSPIDATSIRVTWEPPAKESRNGELTHYTVYYRQHGLESAAADMQVNGTSVVVQGLQPYTEYDLTTQHTGGDTDGWPSWLVARTSPQLLHTQPYVLNISEHGTVQVVLSRATNFATVKRYSVVVVPVNKKDVRHPSTLNHEVLVSNSISMKKRRRRRQTNGEMPYITAEFDAIDIEQIFVVGDAINYGGYINQVLVRGLSYKVFLRAMLKTPFLSFTSSPVSEIFFIPSSRQSSLNPDPTDPTLLESSSDQLWILGPILAAIVILLIVFIILYTRSKSGNQVKYMKPVSKHVTHEPHIQHDPVKMRRQNCKTPGMMSHPPISIHTFQHHVEQLRANDNLKFSQEYESIDPGQQFTWAQSTLEVNKPKNRYANVISYDHSRLTLSPIDGVPGSDYINANYISGFRRQNAYIATQGPMRETVSDFWRMVWEQRSSIICMMTKCEERCKVKCEQYWPSGGSETYGLISVTLIDELELATYCVRTFNVVKSGLSDRREIKHFQFTAWPDHGVPEHPTPVLNFMRRVKSHHQPDAGPIVVHCSAGVGRAGCFICIDAMLERIKYEETVDVYGQVTCMRAERNYMVQTEDQYIFIHDALLEAINSGNTELPAKDLFNHLHKLTTPDPDHPITGMELEFKRLASNKASASRFVSANLPCNKFKNRLVNILPYEGTRVCLQPIRGVEGSDYINASFIDGYRQKRAYIATQGPLPETTDDFWRTLWEHNSTIVVMLTKLREQGRDKCHQYWPAERSARYQYFVVDPMSEYSMQQYMLREFKVTDARDGQSRTVRQFQFTDWPEQAVPKSGEGFIDFIGQVHKTKEQFGQEGPITIHCSGVGRTGVFITLSLALERMRFENLVDMFQTVKMLRTQRPAMVQTEDQYQFCYRAALEYLGSFDHYAM
uniref:protein-tyrosine-phosphatase n=1 Tax=Ciona savignyi TaxID=51511 RepID=H2YZU9_CIOSA